MLHVAILAKLFGIEFLVWAATGNFCAALFVIAILAHAFCIEVSMYVLAIGNHFLLSLRRVMA